MSAGSWVVNFVGTGSLISLPHRAMPATLIDASGFVHLFDCGDGTLARLRQLGKSDVGAVAVTNLGVAELGGIVTLGEMNRRSKRKALPVIGPPGLRHALECLTSISSFSLAELFEVVEAQPDVAHDWGHSQYLEAVPVMVPSGEKCYAYMLYEAALQGRVDAKKAAQLGIRGSDFRRLLAGKSVRGVRPTDVIGPARPGRRLVVVGRGRATEDLQAALQNSDVAIFAAPYTDDRLEVAEDSGYLTGWEAAMLAAEQNVHLCAIQQLGPFSPPWYQLTEARQYHENIFAPDDGSRVHVPLRERGEPRFELPYEGRLAEIGAPVRISDQHRRTPEKRPNRR